MSDLDQRLLAEVRSASPTEATAYLLGAAHDASLSRRHRTTRFTQNNRGWLEVLGLLLQKLNSRSWIYREGRERGVWALETSWRPPPLALRTPPEQAAYVRGYFDAEGGVPRAAEARLYIQFVQKNQADLAHVRDVLTGLGMACGRLHNPSCRVDPEYWRFYVRVHSQANFIDRIGSWHPRKRRRLDSVPRRGSGVDGCAATLCSHFADAE